MLRLLPPIVRCSALLACAAHAAPPALQPAMTPGAARDPSAPVFHLYGSGEQRLAIGEDGHRLLFSPTGENGRQTLFVDSSGTWQLRGGSGEYLITDPAGRVIRPAVAPLAVTTRPAGAQSAVEGHDCPADCDPSRNPPSEGYLSEEGIVGARRLDLRPASCRSYFTDFAPLERGSGIEAALIRQRSMPGMTATVRTFPLVDWFDDDRLTVLHSRDLASESLDASSRPDALLELLLADGRAIERNITDRLAREGRIVVHDGAVETRLEERPGRRTVLVLLVRHGIASASQQEQILRARAQLRERYDIDLQVIEIP